MGEHWPGLRVTQTQARYDEFAEWYEQWIGDAPPLIAAHAGLLPVVAGGRVLDIACGQGRMSRYLAGLGADVTGIDISAAMLGKARAAGPENITYIRAGGWFVASIVHPCFPGSELGRSSWPPGRGYECEGWWTSPDHNPEGVRIRVGATHRKLSTFLNALLDAGLEAERLVEPTAPVPAFLLWRCRRR